MLCYKNNFNIYNTTDSKNNNVSINNNNLSACKVVISICSNNTFQESVKMYNTCNARNWTSFYGTFKAIFNRRVKAMLHL